MADRARARVSFFGDQDAATRRHVQVLAAAPDTPARKDAEAAVASLGVLADSFKKAGEKLGVLVQIPSGG